MDEGMVLRRYKKLREVGSALDPIDDMLNFVGYLTSREYLVELAHSRHGLSLTEAKARAKRILPHVQTGLAYVEQSLLGQKEISFLPAYYAILNFLKVYVLLGRWHGDLPHQRHHGATYKGHPKDSRNLMTERVTLKDKGAIPLFYKTLTGESYPPDYPVEMRHVYPYVYNVGAEYEMCEGLKSDVALIRVKIAGASDGGKVALLRADPLRKGRKFDRRHLKLLGAGWERVRTDPVEYSSGKLPPDDEEQIRHLRSHLKGHLLYLISEPNYPLVTPLSATEIQLPEELPIALLFFHMSSVVRYNPEFLSLLMDSKHWPLLMAARQHCLLKFLKLFWSYAHCEELVLHHG